MRLAPLLLFDFLYLFDFLKGQASLSSSVKRRFVPSGAERFVIDESLYIKCA